MAWREKPAHSVLVEVKPASFEEVRRRYAVENGSAKDGWTLQNLERADRQFGGWVKARLPIESIGNIVLPHHVGGCDRYSGLPQRIHLVPPSGLTVSETHARFSRIRIRYRTLAPYCYDRIDRARQNAHTGLGAFFLSREPLLVGTSYGGLERFRGCLTHLDGLHRLVGMMDADERPDSIECYVAFGDDDATTVRGEENRPPSGISPA